MAISVDCVVRGPDVLGECTIWCDREQLLWWVDIRAPALNYFNPATGEVRSLGLRETIGSFGLTQSGQKMVAAMKTGLYMLDPHSGALELIVAPEADVPGNRFNDGRCDRSGRFWAGTMADTDRKPVGALYRLDADRQCTRIRGGLLVPNSIAWSPDSKVMYLADTHVNCIWTYDFDIDGGAMSNEQLFADTGGRGGRPDGSCVDADGYLWNAEYGGSRVVRYRPDGVIDQIVSLPVSNPTCCCFGGKDFDTLYISTARQRLTPEQLEREPLAGGLFACRPGPLGLPEARFSA
ncbi:MAG: SMP-30/gluconolactonase/LRE family protein [Betaproteobacteria bacterium]